MSAGLNALDLSVPVPVPIVQCTVAYGMATGQVVDHFVVTYDVMDGFGLVVVGLHQLLGMEYLGQNREAPSLFDSKCRQGPMASHWHEPHPPCAPLHIIVSTRCDSEGFQLLYRTAPGAL